MNPGDLFLVITLPIWGIFVLATLPIGDGRYRIQHKPGTDDWRVREGQRVFGFLFGGLDCGPATSLEDARRRVARFEVDDIADRKGWSTVGDSSTERSSSTLGWLMLALMTFLGSEEPARLKEIELELEQRDLSANARNGHIEPE